MSAGAAGTEIITLPSGVGRLISLSIYFAVFAKSLQVFDWFSVYLFESVVSCAKANGDAVR